MVSSTNLPKHDPETEAAILLGIALELHRLTNEAMERARAALARVGRPLPLFPELDEGR